MPEFQILERFSWFHQQVRHKNYPNAGSLATRFGLSARIARRNIDYMQTYLGAPLEYDESRDGYFYSDAGFELSRIQATQEELLAILLARNILAPSAGGLISKAINNFGKKLFATTANIGLTESRMDEAFSATWYGYSPAPSKIFKEVADALLQYRILLFTYTSPLNEETTERQVEPYHLQLYMGSWILIGWCRMRKDWRKFYLSRIKKIEVLHDFFNAKSKDEWHARLNGGFGIFQGDEYTQIVLQFTPERSKWIQEQVWHPQQKIEKLEDGSLLLALPVSDFREIKLRILQFGSDVKVIKPESLRVEVIKEIEKMKNNYEVS